MNLAAIPETGSLSDFSVVTLLRTLAEAGASGTLSVDTSPPRQVCVADGAMCIATTTDLADLRRVLVGGEIVAEQGWQTAIDATPVDGALVDALVHLGGADPTALRDTLYDHTVTTAFELLLDVDGSFRFDRGVLHPIGDRYRFAVADVLADARHRVEAWRTIAADIPSTSLVPAPSATLPSGTDQLVLSADDWKVLQAIDGVRTIAEIVRRLGASAFGVCVVVHRLLQDGAITLGDR